MEDAARFVTILQGAAHRQQAGISMHGVALFAPVLNTPCRPALSMKGIYIMPAALWSQVLDKKGQR